MTSVAEYCRLNSRRRAIVRTARALFAEQGYEQTTLGEIVERAGGSLATVYKLFGSKEGLLEAAVFEHIFSAGELVHEAMRAGGSPTEILHRVATSFDSHFLDVETVALVRIVIARSLCDRAFARQFFERTTTPTRVALEHMFETWRDQGLAMHGPPALLAEVFLGQFVSDVHAEAISHGLGVTRNPDCLRARTDFFLRGAGLSDEPHHAICTSHR